MVSTKPVKSVERQAGESQRRRFSSFDDLARWAVAIGRAQDVEEIRRDSTLWGDLVFEWYAQGQIACLFAISLAREADSTSWYTVVVEGPWNVEMITDLVDAAASAGAAAVQVLFPGAGDAEQALDILAELGAHRRWLCVDVGLREGETVPCHSRQIGLRWLSPKGDYESWVLGLGDFEPMAFTRRFVGAPFVALVLRPTPPEPGRAPAVLGDTGVPAAHLAHLDDELGDDHDKRASWNRGTSAAKRHLIAPGPLSRARAKVTFAFDALSSKLEGLLDLDRLQA